MVGSSLIRLVEMDFLSDFAVVMGFILLNEATKSTIESHRSRNKGRQKYALLSIAECGFLFYSDGDCGDCPGQHFLQHFEVNLQSQVPRVSLQVSLVGEIVCQLSETCVLQFPLQMNLENFEHAVGFDKIITRSALFQ